MAEVERIRFGSRGQGSLVRFSDSQFWFSFYYHRGKEHCESTKTTDIKLARRVHKKTLDKLAADRGGHQSTSLPSIGA